MVKIDNKKCKACGICGDVCPRHIPETVQKDGMKFTTISLERRNLCMACCQCVAVCPNDAIFIDGVELHEFKPVKPLKITAESLQTLMEQTPKD